MKYIAVVRGQLKATSQQAALQVHDAILEKLPPLGRPLGAIGHQAYLNPQTFYLWIVVALLMVTACSPQSTPTVEPTVLPTITSTPEPTPVPTSTPEPTPVPTSTPTATVPPTQAPTASPANLPFTPGKYVFPTDPTSYFTFREDGRWAHYVGSSISASGTYRVEGDIYYQLTNIHCSTPTSFKYSFDGRLLKFQLTDESKNDTCGDRKSFYDRTTYILSP